MFLVSEVLLYTPAGATRTRQSCGGTGPQVRSDERARLRTKSGVGPSGENVPLLKTLLLVSIRYLSFSLERNGATRNNSTQRSAHRPTSISSSTTNAATFTAVKV